MTPSNARHHLSLLLADGRIQAIGSRPAGVRGRPVTIYSARDVFGADHYAALADALLAEWLPIIPEAERESALRALSRRLGGEVVEGGHITRKLAQTILLLNRLGYASRWEARATGPQIILERCPFSVIIGAHPELCRMDAYLLEGQLSSSVEQMLKLEKNERGLPICMFRLV